jgi:intracellular sulfur oxidation DsrE/DsrF family protein
MKLKLINTLASVAVAVFIAASAAPAKADGDHHKRGTQECPVGLVNGQTLDAEFGAGASDATRCLKRRHKVKMVIQINKFCRDSVPNASCTRPYALGNLVNVIKDYEITHGMVAGKDFDIVAVVHSGGGFLLLKGDNPVAPNQFEQNVKNLMDSGVKFYFCQNTVRGFIKAGRLTAGATTSELIEGTKFATAGITAITDFQSVGYTYVQP